MAEEEPNQPNEPKDEEPKQPVAPASSKKPKNSIEQANEVLANMERVRDETKEWVERAEAFQSEQILSGEAEAGSTPATPTKEEEIQARCNKQLEGTGLKI